MYRGKNDAEASTSRVQMNLEEESYQTKNVAAARIRGWEKQPSRLKRIASLNLQEDEVKAEFLNALEAIKLRRTSLKSSESKKKREAPSCLDMTLKVLAQHSDSLKSLEVLPDTVKRPLSNYICELGTFNTHDMILLTPDTPSEIVVNCGVNLEEKRLFQILSDCDTKFLQRLVLNLCGKAMTENLIFHLFKRSPNKFQTLQTLSLQGSSITDYAVSLISSLCPALHSVNFSYCSLLTPEAVKFLADNFANSLIALNIGYCQRIIESSVFTKSLYEFKVLKYLSVAGIQELQLTVFMFISLRGSKLKDLCLSYCHNMFHTLVSLDSCPNLETLDISYIFDLRELDLDIVAERCRSVKSIKLTKFQFSDEAIAEFLTKLPETEVHITGLDMHSPFTQFNGSFPSLDGKYF